MGPELVWILQRRAKSFDPVGFQTSIPRMSTLLPSYYLDYAILVFFLVAAGNSYLFEFWLLDEQALRREHE